MAFTTSQIHTSTVHREIRKSRRRQSASGPQISPSWPGGKAPWDCLWVSRRPNCDSSWELSHNGYTEEPWLTGGTWGMQSTQGNRSLVREHKDLFSIRYVGKSCVASWCGWTHYHNGLHKDGEMRICKRLSLQYCQTSEQHDTKDRPNARSNPFYLAVSTKLTAMLSEPVWRTHVPLE